MPTHPIEGADYIIPGSGALSGERIHKDAAPATEFRQYQANALWHGLRGLVKAEQIAGDLTAASGSADQAEGYIRLAKAFRRAANRKNQVSIVLAGMSTIFDPDPDAHTFILSEDVSGPYDNAFVYPATDNPTRNDRRVIMILNNTTSRKTIGITSGSPDITLNPGESQLFYGRASSGVTVWHAVGHADDNSEFKSFSALLRDSANTGNNSAITLRYRKVNRIVTVYIPLCSLTFGTSPGNLHIVPSTGTVPVDLKPFNSVIQLPATVFRNGTLEHMYADIEAAATTGRFLNIHPVPVFANTDAIQIASQCFTYLGL